MSKPEYDMHADYEAFKTDLPQHLAEHPGEHVVYHDTKVVDFFDSFAEAVQFGDEEYGMRNFIVQEVIDTTQIASYSLTG